MPTDFRFNQPLTKDEIDAVRQQPHPELMALRADAVLATFDQYEQLAAALKAEIDVLRGVDCEADGDGPCGVCIKCAKCQFEDAISAAQKVCVARATRDPGGRNGIKQYDQYDLWRAITEEAHQCAAAIGFLTPSAVKQVKEHDNA